MLWGDEAEEAAGAADGERRAVRFMVEEAVESPGALPLRPGSAGYSKFNPAVG